MRLASNDPGARKKADTPALFREQRNPEHFVAIPIVSSERRQYVPMGYLGKETIAGNKLFIIEDATLFHFGVLTSSVHMSWMRVVCGRLEMRYTYSKDIVYNNFPWPSPSGEQKTKIEATAQTILDARALYPDSSLADLYDDLTMPVELRKAHRANDAAVMEAYGFRNDMTESDIVAELFKQYDKLTRNDMNLINFSEEFSKKIRTYFRFYNGEVKCPFDNMPLIVMWNAERDLLYSEKVFSERIRKNVIKFREDDFSLCSIRDSYLASEISMMVNKKPFFTGHEVVLYYYHLGVLGLYGDEMIRLAELSKNKGIR